MHISLFRIREGQIFRYVLSVINSCAHRSVDFMLLIEATFCMRILLLSHITFTCYYCCFSPLQQGWSFKVGMDKISKCVSIFMFYLRPCIIWYIRIYMCRCKIQRKRLMNFGTIRHSSMVIQRNFYAVYCITLRNIRTFILLLIIDWNIERKICQLDRLLEIWYRMFDRYLNVYCFVFAGFCSRDSLCFSIGSWQARGSVVLTKSV